MDAAQNIKACAEDYDFKQQFQEVQTNSNDFSQAHKKRKLLEKSVQGILPSADMAYDGDVDDEFSESKHALNVPIRSPYSHLDTDKIQSERTHIYEFFQPWALKTYGDQAKTKTITMRKKARILKALEGKEHSRPDSSKFRFWVKSKGFTTKRPEGFEENPASSRSTSTLPPDAVLSDNPSRVDLFVASRNKENGKRLFRKVAVVEEFFDIIYNVHMELGGRSGMHAGQKRTYRIITETYAFLPREAVTRFLSTCPECKKNLRPTSPGASSNNAEQPNESSSEVEVLNYSSHTESSLEAGPTLKNNNFKSISNPITTTALAIPNKPTSSQDNNSQKLPTSTPKRSNICIPHISSSLLKPLDSAILPATKPDVTISPFSSTFSRESPFATDNNNLFKSQEHLLRYYDFVRRFYSTGMSLPDNQIHPIASTSRHSLSKHTLPSPRTPSSHSLAKSNVRHLSDDEDDTFSPTVKKFKTFSHSQANNDNLVPKSNTTPVQCSVLNLSKQLSCRSQVKTSESDVATGEENLNNKDRSAELRKKIKHEPESKEDANPKKNSLPPLDLESLKPITSTYLQLTRSMGLSDEDALRFDNLVSEDFKYSL